MARIRTIKPDFFKNEQVADCSPLDRLFFIGLWTQADREGRVLNRPKRLKAEILPYDTYKVDDGINKLEKAGLIFQYDVEIDNGGQKELVKSIQIINFLKHQKIDKHNEKESEIPECKDITKRLFIVDLKPSTSLPIVGEGKGKEGKGIGREGKDPPTLLEVIAYFKENGFSENLAKRAFNGYNEANWHDSKGNKVLNWKQKMINVWFKPENNATTNSSQLSPTSKPITKDGFGKL